MNEEAKQKFVLSAADRASLPEVLHSLAEEHGPEMVSLICNAGVAKEAATQLTNVLHLAQHAQGLAALRVLVQAFNMTADGLAQTKGWSFQTLASVTAECERLLEAQIVVAPKGRIILPH